jgi:hypothetical protein
VYGSDVQALKNAAAAATIMNFFIGRSLILRSGRERAMRVPWRYIPID